MDVDRVAAAMLAQGPSTSFGITANESPDPVPRHEDETDPLGDNKPESHIVTIKTEVRDAEAVKAACRRLGLDEPVQGTARLFEGEATGLLVKLPGWLYPAVVDTDTGQVRYDNYEGQWGDPKHLDAFLQSVCHRARPRSRPRKRGHSVFEQPLPDGSVKLTIQVGGVS